MPAVPLHTTSPDSIPLADAIRQRRSVRGFLPTPVPAEVLADVFALAQLAPSNCNIQPWQVFVASGGARDELRQRMLAGVATGESMNPTFGMLPPLSAMHRQRQVDCAMALYGSMGIARGDQQGRLRALLRNFELFDAPHVCFIGMDRSFGVPMAVDVGMYAQSLMLAMTAYGIGSCAQGALSYYPEMVCDVFGVDQERIAILLGISFGYEDTTVAANRTRTRRAALPESVMFKS